MAQRAWCARQRVQQQQLFLSESYSTAVDKRIKASFAVAWSTSTAIDALTKQQCSSCYGSALIAGLKLSTSQYR
jgi:hypothetical protein